MVIQMEITKKWQKALHISPSDYQQWLKEAGSEDLVTAWALENNKIQASQYFTWAMDYYQIPYLKESFFHQIPVQLSLWNKTKNQIKWNKYFLPLYEWEGLVFAACVEPPAIQHKNIFPILVKLDNLRFCWTKIESFTKNPSTSPALQTKQEPFLPKNVENQNLATKIHKFVKTKIFNLTKLTPAKATPGSAFSEIVELTKGLFSHAIIFSYNHDRFHPVRWNNLKGCKEPVSIKENSIFKMVHKTLQPYHGFIVSNPAHKQFFTKWGFASLPKHITLMPITRTKKENQLIGAFMGIADTTIPSEELNRIASCMNQLEEMLPPQHPSPPSFLKAN